MKPDIVIYHQGCQDGFTAAWAAWSLWGDTVEYLPAHYQTPAPDVAGKSVLIVDFSYKRPVLEEMASVAKRIVVLDHHESAAADLAPFEVSSLHTLASLNDVPFHDGERRILALFDMERSGALMTWQFLHPAKPAPRVVRHVNDRDLWRFELEGTKEVCEALYSHPFDFQTWSEFKNQLESDFGRRAIVAQGAALLRKHERDLRQAVERSRREIVIAGHRVPCANVPKFMASDAGHILAEGQPFAAVYFDARDHREFSLRSSKEGGLNVREIAERFGGGGHANAAGFSVPIGWEGDAA